MMALGLARPHAGADMPRAPATGWRDDLRLGAGVVGGAFAVFVPAATFVVGAWTPDLARFAAALVATWAASTLAMLATLRGLRLYLPALPPAIVWLAVAAAGVAMHLALRSWMTAYSLTLGLDVDDAWASVVGAWTVVLAAAYLVWEREARARRVEAQRRLVAVQRAQLQLRRAVTDAQIAAVHGRVSPTFFFDTLASIDALYSRDPARAERLMDALIDFLRCALTGLEHASASMAHEVDIVRAALRVDAVASGNEHRLEVTLPRELGGLPFPAGVLLPLLRTGARKGGAHALSVATTDGGRLRLEVSRPGPPDPEGMATVATALRLRYGSSARLEPAEPGPAGERQQLEVPLEP